MQTVSATIFAFTDSCLYSPVTDHRRTLTHPTYPVVNVGNATHPVLVPPEVCEVLDGQLCDAKLLSSQTKAMVEVAARDPQQNGELICGQGVDVMGLKQRHGPVLITTLHHHLRQWLTSVRRTLGFTSHRR